MRRKVGNCRATRERLRPGAQVCAALAAGIGLRRERATQLFAGVLYEHFAVEAGGAIVGEHAVSVRVADGLNHVPVVGRDGPGNGEPADGTVMTSPATPALTR